MRNELASESSLYLRQHADNPVHWQGWNNGALSAARSQDKPILLSIGYSACHWCHVMAHESFESEEIAALMNSLFVNIKVDREERPDLDKVYQLTHQLMNHRGGGWPLTVFLDPVSLAPFFSGTYFPPEPRHGMPAFPAVLKQLAAAFSEQRDQISGQREQLDSVFARMAATPGPACDAELPDRAAAAICEQFDERWGGWSGAPKFPHPQTIDFLLAATQEAAAPQALHSLRCMIRGGLFDQLRGGFYRYSVDERWEIPHFEKMLYDNAQLLSSCAQGYRREPEPLLRRAISDTVDWLDAEMADDSGLFYATLDADSEGIEGRFYAWEREAVLKLAGADADLAQRCFGLLEAPNFEGQYHLQLRQMPDEPELPRFDALRQRLLSERAKRTRPGRDEKILTAWNALLASGLIHAASACDELSWLERAEALLNSLHQRHWQDGCLAALSHAGEAGRPGFLDDYAFSLQALMDLLGQRWNTGLLIWAVELADAMLERFGSEDGALYFAEHDEHLIHRPQPLMDDALPAGNAIACRALLQLGELLAEPRYISAAENILAAAAEAMTRHPQAHVGMLLALRESNTQSATLVLRAPAEQSSAWRAAAADAARVYCIAPDEQYLPKALAVRAPRDEATGYLCRRGVCSAPLGSPEELTIALAAELAARSNSG